MGAGAEDFEVSAAGEADSAEVWAAGAVCFEATAVAEAVGILVLEEDAAATFADAGARVGVEVTAFRFPAAGEVGSVFSISEGDAAGAWAGTGAEDSELSATCIAEIGFWVS